MIGCDSREPSPVIETAASLGIAGEASRLQKSSDASLVLRLPGPSFRLLLNIVGQRTADTPDRIKRDAQYPALDPPRKQLANCPTDKDAALHPRALAPRCNGLGVSRLNTPQSAINILIKTNALML